jgi:hypothetical protein
MYIGRDHDPFFMAVVKGKDGREFGRQLSPCPHIRSGSKLMKNVARDKAF